MELTSGASVALMALLTVAGVAATVGILIALVIQKGRTEKGTDGKGDSVNY